VSAALLLLCVGLGLGAAGAVALVAPPGTRLGVRLRQYTAPSAAGRGGAAVGVASTPPRSDSAFVAVFGAPWHAIVGALGRRLERRDDDELRLALRRAGLRDATPAEHRARVAAAALTGAVAGGALGLFALHAALAALGLAAAGAISGVARARGRIEKLAADRCERIRLELVTVDQLLAMHLRTGAGPVQAVRRIVEQGEGAVIEELSDVLDMLRHGATEPAAFRRAADLTPEPAAARTYRLFATGVERGVDLADGLRALSDDLRDARREEIRKTAVRRRAAMLVPTIAVLAPVMLLFIAAPLPSIVFGSR
jgi:Flp pilus assembly protein TadB